MVTFEKTTLPDGSPYVHLRLDKSKIWTVGKEAMRKFLIVSLIRFAGRPARVLERVDTFIHSFVICFVSRDFKCSRVQVIACEELHSSINTLL